MRIVRALFARGNAEAEMDAELRLHVELEAEELERGGMSAEEARRQAALAFGGVERTKDDARDTRFMAWVVNARRDVRIAMRTLRRNRTFAITATLALALAIAVNTTMFSVLDALMNPELGASHPEQLFELSYFGDPRKKVDFNERERAFQATLGLHQAWTEYMYADITDVERHIRADGARVVRVRPTFFTTLGVRPQLGKLVPGGVVVSGSEPVVISNRIAALFFEKDESPLGQGILLDGQSHTIIGVTQRIDGFDPLRYDVWMFAPPEQALSWKIVRLKDGETLEDTDRRLRQLALQFAIAGGADPKSSWFRLAPEQRQFHATRFHFALVGAGIAILIVACTNLANLQLARGLTRSAELAVRSALGATRRQVITQLLVESGVLAAAALVVALVLTLAGNAILRAYVPPSVGEFVVEPHSSWRMVIAAAVAAVICLLAIGLLPALRISRVDLNTLLKGRAGTGMHRSNRRIYGTLVVTQIALTLPLICAAVMLTRSAARSADFDYLIHEQVGYDPRPIVDVYVPMPVDSTQRRVSLGATAAEVIARIEAVPGVTSAALMNSRPVVNNAITVDDADGNVRQVSTPMTSYWMVTPEVLATFGLPLVEGRNFSASGSRDPEVIVDQFTASVLWPHGNPVGRTIKFSDKQSRDSSMRVIGVYHDHLSTEAREMQWMMSESRVGRIYRLITEQDSMALRRYRSSLTVRARVSGDPAVAAESIRRRLQNGPRTTPTVILHAEGLGLAQRRIVTRFIAGLFTVFGILALGLSALGVYAIVAQSVTDRQREVAVRIALGATPRSIVHALLREGNVLVLAGVAIGLYLTKETVGWIEMFLQVDIYSAPFFALMCVALFGAMVFAALVPAVRATTMDPMEVLRAE